MTLTEENYIKGIYHLGKQGKESVSTNAVAKAMKTKASSATDMIKKLSDKQLVNYIKYQGVSLTTQGQLAAKSIIRKHRLWEVFLVEKLNFNWDEVHDVAEQLEHIKSQKLIDEIDALLGFPTVDPHGDLIPDKNGNLHPTKKRLLSSFEKNESGICTGVQDSSSAFLQFLDKQGIALGKQITVIAKEPFDDSITIKIDDREMTISKKIATNLYLKIDEHL